jgi:hypothetical protein
VGAPPAPGNGRLAVPERHARRAARAASRTPGVGAVCWAEFLKSYKCDDELSPQPHWDVPYSRRAAGGSCDDRTGDVGRELLLSSRTDGRPQFDHDGRRLHGRRRIFSSGVFPAMKGAFLGGDAATACVDRSHPAKRALRRFETEVLQVNHPLFLVRHPPRRFSDDARSLHGRFVAPRSLLSLSSVENPWITAQAVTDTVSIALKGARQL